MSEISDLLKSTRDDNKKERQKAVKELGELDKRFSGVIERLEDLKENDPEKGVRKEAEKSLKNLENLPEAEVIAAVEGGEEGTGFDDEVGDTSLELGEYDMESSLPKTEEDRRERMAAGKGILVSLKESNTVTMNYHGDVVDKQPSKGQISVQNTGISNRISGVDLTLRGLENVQSDQPIDDKTVVGLLVPGKENEWKAEYRHEKEFSPIKIEQNYEDPVTGLSPNFAGENQVDFVANIIVTNATAQSIFNVNGIKTLNEHASLIGSNASSGMITSKDEGVSFDIEEIPAGESVTLTLNLSASIPEDTPTYRSGELKVTYDNRDELISGLQFVSVDGVSDVGRKIKRKQRETEPGFYDCEIRFENRSEFVYDLNKFSVFADSMDSQQIVLDWDGSQATQDEREIVPGEKVSFEFVYESFQGTPTFGDYVEFSVQHELDISTQTTILLPAEDLKHMALDIIKSFMVEGESVNKFELPSYVETEVPSLITITGIGTYPIEGIVIKDEIPEGFRPPVSEQITISRGTENLSEGQYNISFEEGITGNQDLVVTLDHLEETSSGGLGEGDIISVKYLTIAENPVPQDEAIQTQAHAEGFVYSAPDSKVRASSAVEELELIVVHRRDDLDIGKMIESLDIGDGSNGYKIRLEAENYGSSTATFFIEDLVPDGFRLMDDSMESEPPAQILDPKFVENGTVRGWKFENIKPNEEVWASYIVVEESNTANPRKLQSVYRG